MGLSLKYVSVCAGIGSASVAWRPQWQPVAFSEIDDFASAVLAHHYPGVPNLGDMLSADWSALESGSDILIGGTPCQAFSVAGRRRSLGDARGNLTLKFVEIVDAIKPAIVVWENVPGVLSTRDNAFGCLLSGLLGEDAPLLPGTRNSWTNAGFCLGQTRSVAWRVLDAQYFGVPQRRRRVFLVAVDFRAANRLLESLREPGCPLADASDRAAGVSIRDRGVGRHLAGTCDLDLARDSLAGLPAAILFEPESEGRDPSQAQGEEEEEPPARSTETCVGGIGVVGVALPPKDIVSTHAAWDAISFVATEAAEGMTNVAPTASRYAHSVPNASGGRIRSLSCQLRGLDSHRPWRKQPVGSAADPHRVSSPSRLPRWIP